MEKLKVLIIDDMHPSIFSLLEDINMEADYRPNISKEEVKSMIGEYEGVIVRSKIQFDASVLQQAKKLRFIGRAGSGLELIDLATAQQFGIKVVNAPEGNRDAVAEHALGMLLMLFNNLKKADHEVRNFIWQREENRGLELRGKTVGIIGYGNVGKEFAKRLSSFDCKVLAYDRKKKNYGNQYAQEASMQQLFEEIDILSLHVSMNDESKNLVDAHFMQQFKKGIYLLNTSRGEVINLKDLCQMMESQKVLGACLDVLENEKLRTLTPQQRQSFDYLTRSEKVILSPHIAGWTRESYQRINEVLVEKIKGLDLF